MRQLGGNRRTGPLGSGTVDGGLTVTEATAIWAEQARLAQHCAQRAEQARASEQYGAMRHWTREYRRATTQCRSLGEQIRRRSQGPPATECRRDENVVPMTRRMAPGVRPGGEAA